MTAVTRLRRFATVLAAMLLAFSLLAPAPARADAKLAVKLAIACNKELKTYCSNVTVGGGRKLACLFAYNDQLGFLCERAMLEAGAELERAILSLRQAADLCAGDIARFCARAIPGQGRIAMCLAAHQPQLTPACAGSLDALRYSRR